MAVSMRCPKCKTWTRDSDYCQNCNEFLDFTKTRDAELEERKQVEAAKPPDKIDVFFHRFKHSRFWPVRAVYYFFYSIWFVLSAIVSFFMLMMAAGPG